MELRIFFDGNCPLCSAEMRQLKARDPDDRIELVDLNADNFSSRFSYIDKDYANTILHGRNRLRPSAARLMSPAKHGR